MKSEIPTGQWQQHNWLVTLAYVCVLERMACLQWSLLKPTSSQLFKAFSVPRCCGNPHLSCVSALEPHCSDLHVS